MKYFNNVFVYLIIAAVIAGAYFFPLSSTSVVKEVFGSATGSTEAQQAQLYITGWNLANGTTTSVQNTSGSDVYATQIQTVCTGVGTSQTAYTGAGLASLTIKAATTSASLQGQTPTSNTGVTNTNLAASITAATSSATFLLASSTEAAGGSYPGVWIPNGAWITFFSNATNTATCNIGVQTITT